MGMNTGRTGVQTVFFKPSNNKAFSDFQDFLRKILSSLKVRLSRLNIVFVAVWR